MPWVFAGLVVIFAITIIFEWGAQGTAFQSGRQDPNTIAIVDGQTVTVAEYEQTVEMMANQQRQQQQKAELSEQEMEQVRTQAWDQVIGRAIIKNQIAEMGLNVTDAELREAMFYNPPPDIRQQFTDSTGNFRQDAYWQALRDPRNDTIVRAFTENYRDQLLMNKWQQLMTAALRVTNAEIQTRFHQENDKATVNVVRIMPTAPPTEFISKVTDDEARKYYEEHKNRYKAEERRKVRFVLFSTAASGRDSVVAMEGIESVRKRLAAAPLDNIDSLSREMADELGVESQGVQVIPPQLWGQDPAIMNAKPGDAVITRGQQPMVTKIISVEDTGQSMFNSRHILIGFGRPENRDSALALANDIYNQIKGGAKFEEMALKYSQDGSARQGGDLGWVGPGQFVPEFEAVAKKAPIGEVQPPVASQFGYHIIEVKGRTNKTIMGVSFPMSVKSSSRTAQITNQQAVIFRNRAEEDGFEAAAKAMGKDVITDVPPLEKAGQPLFGSSAFMDWAFRAEKDDISTPFKIPQAQMIVVAQIVDVTPKGFQEFEDVKESIKMELAKKLRIESVKARAEQLRNSIQAGQGLASLAATTGDSTLKPTNMTIGPAEAAGAMGIEYVINHAAYDLLKPGEISRPLRGETGYYIIELVNRQLADPKGVEAARSSIRQTLTNERQQRFVMQYIENLKKKADIQDFRNPL